MLTVNNLEIDVPRTTHQTRSSCIVIFEFVTQNNNARIYILQHYYYYWYYYSIVF